MKTHYIKTKTITSNKLYNELESIIYSILIEDELMSEEKLFYTTNQQIKKEHGSIIYSIREVKDCVRNLVDRKLIKEIIGSKLSKIVNTK